VDYDQREYRWATEHVAGLIEDLTAKFVERHDRTDHGLPRLFVGAAAAANCNGDIGFSLAAPEVIPPSVRLTG